MKLNQKVIKLIKHYQDSKDLTIGSGRCKHYPSCSNYAIECYKKFNFLKASFLSGFRILRCNPLTKKIYDPVPLTKKEKRKLKEKYQNLSFIIPKIIQFNEKYPFALPIDYICYIYDLSSDNINNENNISTLFYDYLYVFKNAVKKKNIPLKYKEVYPVINDYLMHDFVKPIHSNEFINLSSN